MQDRHIGPRHRATRELLDERVVGGARLGDDEQARGVLVEPVHDAGAAWAAHTGDPRGVGEQRRGECPARVACARMDDEPGGLVEDEHLLVLVHDRERRGLGRERLRRRRRDLDLDQLARPEPVRGLPGAAVHPHVAVVDQALGARA